LPLETQVQLPDTIRDSVARIKLLLIVIDMLNDFLKSRNIARKEEFVPSINDLVRVAAFFRNKPSPHTTGG
jgi:nicotinamidase-related amidase